MKRTLYILAALSALCAAFSTDAGAQEYELVDSVVFRMADAADSTLYGKNIISLMPSRGKGDIASVNVNQSGAIASAMDAHIRSNSSRTLKGFRVRIFFDNKQSSRNASMAAYNAFREAHHDIPAYRTYVNPYFKVTVGDFRTKSEAMQFMARIKSEFPNAFVIKENIKFPVVDKTNAFVADTVKVRRRIQ